MSRSSSRMWRVLRDLVFAMLNATLILLALCLFLGLRLAGTVDDITNDIAQNLVSVEPLREDVQGMSAEIAALRVDLAAVRETSGEMTSETAQALTERIASFDDRMAGVQSRIDEMRGKVAAVAVDPRALLDHAIEVATNEVARNVAGIAGCSLPDRPEALKAADTTETAGQ